MSFEIRSIKDDKATPRVKKGRFRPVVEFKDHSHAAKQSFAPELDINKIWKRALETGELPNRKDTPVYADVSRMPGYHESQDMLIRANKIYQGLKPELKAEMLNLGPDAFFKKHLSPPKAAAAPTPASGAIPKVKEAPVTEDDEETPPPPKPVGKKAV